MEDTTRLKLILVGLFLAALALGYLFLSQRKTDKSNFQAQKPIQQMEQATSSAGISPTGAPATLGQATDQPQTTKGGQSLPKTGISSLPATGAPELLLGAFSASAVIIGWSLKKFPK